MKEGKTAEWRGGFKGQEKIFVLMRKISHRENTDLNAQGATAFTTAQPTLGEDPSLHLVALNSLSFDKTGSTCANLKPWLHVGQRQSPSRFDR